MGRRGWAITIIIFFIAVTIGVLTTQSNELGMGEATGPLVWDEGVVEGTGPSKVVQLFVEGAIAEAPGFTSSFYAEQFISQLDQAIIDPDVKAVVIRVNSPGGEVVASDEIHSKIEEVQQHGIPVVVSMGAIASQNEG